MPKVACLLLTTFLLTGCSPLGWMKPDEVDVDRLERLLNGEGCIGDLARWQRRYSFARESGQSNIAWPDRKVINFSFREAGAYEFRSGRTIESFDDVMRNMVLDHRQMRFAFGEYNVDRDQVVLLNCGWNCDASVPPGGSCG